MKERTDPHLNILMDIQTQIGDIKSETTKQSAQLTALNEKVAIQNGKVFKSIQDIQDIKDERNINKGKMFVFMAIGGFVMTIVSALLVVLIKKYFGIWKY